MYIESYITQHDDKGVEHIYTTSEKNDKQSIATLLDEDIYSLALFIKNAHNPQTLQFYWEEIPKAKISHLDYFTYGAVLLTAFAENKNTPYSIAEEVLAGNPSQYGDIWMGIEPDIKDKFLKLPCVDEKLKHKYHAKKARYSQQDFNDVYDSLAKAYAALANDPELKNRLRSVKEQHYGLGMRLMQFDPEDVEAVGLEYLHRYHIHLFGVEYHGNGKVLGYIDQMILHLLDT